MVTENGHQNMHVVNFNNKWTRICARVPGLYILHVNTPNKYLASENSINPYQAAPKAWFDIPPSNQATTKLAFHSNEKSKEKLSIIYNRLSIIVIWVHAKLHKNLFISTCSLHWNIKK